MTDQQWPFDPALKTWGATYTPAIVTPGQEYWRLIRAEGPKNIGDNHHIYMDILDQAGRRVVDIPVLMYWQDETVTKYSKAKPGEPAALSIPMYAGGNAYGIRMVDGRPSDDIFGMGLGSFVPHHSFMLIFQLATATEQPSDPPDGPIVIEPDPPITVAEALEYADFYLQMARKLLTEAT